MAKLLQKWKSCANSYEKNLIYRVAELPFAVTMTLFGLVLAPFCGGIGAVIFFVEPLLLITMDARLEGLFVLGTDCGAAWPFLGGWGACPLAGVACASFLSFVFEIFDSVLICCLQLSRGGAQTMPLMMTPLKMVSFFTLSRLSGLSTGVGDFTILFVGIGDKLVLVGVWPGIGDVTRGGLTGCCSSGIGEIVRSIMRAASSAISARDAEVCSGCGDRGREARSAWVDDADLESLFRVLAFLEGSCGVGDGTGEEEEVCGWAAPGGRFTQRLKSDRKRRERKKREKLET